jgi:hypothetical protein
MAIVKHIADLITNMALLGDEGAKVKLCADAQQYSITEWKLLFQTKVTTIGAITGIPGGIGGALFTTADILYLFTASGRACYGIGYIIDKRPVDYDSDIANILSIWAGVAKATNRVAVGKFGLKLSTQAIIGPATLHGILAVKAFTTALLDPL